MARLPDGWVFITHIGEPEVKDGKIVVSIDVDKKKLVMCKHCKYRWDPIGCQMYSEGMSTSDDWYCADGEEDECGD